MKIRMSFLLAMLVNSLFIMAQPSFPVPHSPQTDPCGQQHSQEKLYQENPQLRPENNPAHQALEQFTEQYAAFSNRNNVVLTIPVVVHVVHDNGPENLTDEEIIDGIALINEDFSATNEEIPSEIHSSFLNIVANCEMNFELARFDPNGIPTTGITRQVSSYTYAGDDPNMKLQYNWPREKYLNVWLVNKPFAGNSSSGFAYYPPSVDDPIYAHYDGVVIAYWAYGRHDETAVGYEHVMSHEIGHWANLKHTWGDQSDFGTAAACNDDDLVDDTPNTQGHAFYGDCTLETFSCGTLDNNNNFMDYTGTCTGMFTLGQKDRMLASMYSSISGRNNLWTASNIEATLGDPAAPLMVYNTLTISEDIANDGTVNSSMEVTLNNATFSQSTGPFSAGVHYNITGLPTGLAADINVTSSTSLTVTISGTAANHADADDVTYTIAFQDAAFSEVTAAEVGGSNNPALLIDFLDPYTVVYVDLEDPFAEHNGQDWEFFALNYGDAEFGTWLYDSDFFKLETYGNGAICHNGTRNIVPLDCGVTIGNSDVFTEPDVYPGQLDISNPSYTDWNGRTAYIGFTFRKGGYDHYGWLKATVPPDGSKFTVTEGAYHTGPAYPITTGMGCDATLNYTPPAVTESITNDGSFNGFTNILTENVVFSQSSGSFIENTHYTISGLPAGLTASMEVISNTLVELHIDGTTIPHADTDDTNISVSFLDAAFEGTLAANVVHATNAQVLIDFRAAYEVVCVDLNDPFAEKGGQAWEYFTLNYGNTEFGTWLFENDNFKLETYGKGMMCYPNTRNIQPLGSGVEVSANSTFTPPGDYPDQLDVSNLTYTAWNGYTGYMGFEFYKDGYIHYGWFLAEVTPSGDRFTILEAAYNTAPNGAVYTGSCGIVIPPGGYCEAYTELDYNHITNVNVAGINHNSVWNNGYGNFTNLLGQMEAGENYTLNLNFESEHWPDIAVGAWIDWNMDGDFEDANEEVYRVRSEGPFGANINVPMDIPNGVTRFRVRLGYGADMDACGYDDYQGEVEDYSMQLLGVALATEVLDFEAKKSGENILLNWQTTNEEEIAYFMIEKSDDGRTFEKIGEKIAKKERINLYHFTDSEPMEGLNYYRLRQVDYSGQEHFSGVKVVHFNTKNDLFIYPNPVGDEFLNLSFEQNLEEPIVIEIFDYTGRIVLTQQILNTNDYQLDVSDFSKGVYILSVGERRLRLLRL